MTVTKAERTLDAALAALAERPGGMLIREMEEALPGELHRYLREAVRRGVQSELIEYAPDRDGRGGARAYRLTPAAPAAASGAGEPGPAPPPKVAREPAPGSLGHAILLLLSGSENGMTCAEVIAMHGAAPSKRIQCMYADRLRAALSLGYVRRQRERRTDARGRTRETWVWQVTGEGRDALAGICSPKPAPAPKAKYAWAAGAAARHEAGEQVNSIARSLPVSAHTVKRAIEARGVTVVPHSRAQPPWAAQAARRYEAGETRTALASEYGVWTGKMGDVLEREGVTLRDRRAAGRMWRAARGGPGPEPAKPAEPARAEIAAPSDAVVPAPGTAGEVTVISSGAHSPQLSSRQ